MKTHIRMQDIVIQRINCFLYSVWSHLYNRWLWPTPTYSQAVQLSTTRACGSPDRHLSTPVEWLNSYCAIFSLAIVWAAGRETHKSLPSLSHRKSIQATPLQTFQQHPPHHQCMLKPRLHGTIKSCPKRKNGARSHTTAFSGFPPKFSLCLGASGFNLHRVEVMTNSDVKSIIIKD